jgi:hypothetical protein
MFFEGFGEGGPGHTTSWEIRVVTPGGRVPVSWPRGSTKTIAWRIDGGHPPERPFLVTLKRGADTVNYRLAYRWRTPPRTPFPGHTQARGGYRAYNPLGKTHMG